MTQTTYLPNGLKLKPLSLPFLSFLISAMVTAQSIHFDYIDGTTAAYNLEDLRKITFDADVMNLHMLDGSLYAWNVSTIGNNQYDATPLNVEDWIHTANAMEVVVFPSPAGVGVMAVTKIRLPLLTFFSSIKSKGSLAFSLP